MTKLKTFEANSYPCKICGQVYTEESGATENFICENCFGDININPFRQVASEIIDHLDSQRGHTTKGERYYQLEDDITLILQKGLGLPEK